MTALGVALLVMGAIVAVAEAHYPSHGIAGGAGVLPPGQPDGDRDRRLLTAGIVIEDIVGGAGTGTTGTGANLRALEGQIARKQMTGRKEKATYEPFLSGG